jgi:hypothetical protein
MKGQTFSQFPTPALEVVESLINDLRMIEYSMKPAEPAALNIMLGRLSCLPKTRAASNMSDEQAEMALFDQIEALSDLPADLIELARQRCMRNCGFVPSPLEIRTQIKPEIDEREMASSFIRALLLKAGVSNP